MYVMCTKNEINKVKILYVKFLIMPYYHSEIISTAIPSLTSAQHGYW